MGVEPLLFPSSTLVSSRAEAGEIGLDGQILTALLRGQP